MLPAQHAAADSVVTEYITLTVPISSGDWNYYGHNAKWSIYALSQDVEGNKTLDEITGISGGMVMNGHVITGNVADYNFGSMEIYDSKGNQFNDGSDFGIISGNYGFNLMNGVTGVTYKMKPTGSSKEQDVNYDDGQIDLGINF